MNGFKMMAESYRNSLEQGDISKAEAEKEIRVFEFLATCDDDDICRLVDSSAFNDIIRAYLELSLRNAEVDDDVRSEVMNQLRWNLSEKTAKEVLGKYVNR